MKGRITRYLAMFILLQLSSCIRDEILLPPSITGLSSDSIRSGEVLIIQGQNFDPKSFQAFIDGTIAPVAGAVTQNEVGIIVPFVEDAKEVSLHVSTRFGKSDEMITFTILPPVPVVRKVIPDMGKIGSQIKIAGKFFNNITTVEFQSPNQVNRTTALYSVIHKDTLLVTVPEGLSQDAASIFVSSESGSSGSATFTVVYPPSITGFSPESQGVGALVTLTGGNLRHTKSVKFGQIDAKVISITEAKVQVKVPEGAVSDTIYVTTLGGAGKTSKKFIVMEGPKITSLDKETASVGSAITITGLNFSGAFEVRFASTPAVITTNTGTIIKTTVPSNASSGKITISTPYGTDSTANDFIVAGAPFINTISPTSVAKGKIVTLSGLHFGDATGSPRTIKIGTVNVTNINTWSDNLIQFTVPLTAASGKITLTAPTGAYTTTSQLIIIGAAKVNSFTPASGVPGTEVTIKGENFSLTPDVRFSDDVKVTSISKATATEIICIVPVGTITGKITVDNAPSLTDFTINLKPVITSITPMRGGKNSEVVINGTYLTGAVVKFASNLTATPVGTSTDSKITVTVPGLAVTGKISVSNTSGITMSTTNFEVLGAPTITSFTPSSGIAGTQVTITGTNLQHTPVVTFATNAAAVIKSTSATQLIVEVPAAATTGKISVKTDAVSSPVASASNFTLVNKPAITLLTPNTGTIGRKVVITGTDFKNVTTVTFDGIATNNFIVPPTTTRIEVRVPDNVSATSERAINVSVNTTAGGSTNKPFTILVTPKLSAGGTNPSDNPRNWALGIGGSSLGSIERVTINGADAPIDYKAYNFVTTRVPAGATPGVGELRLYYTDIHFLSAAYTVLATPPPGVFPPPFIIIPPPPPTATVPANIDAEWPHPYAVPDYVIDLRTDDKDANGKYLPTGSIRVNGIYRGEDPELKYLLDGKSGTGGWNRQSIWIDLDGEYYSGAFSDSFQMILSNSATGRQLVLGAPCAGFPNCK